jgi:hypothetical protein
LRSTVAAVVKLRVTAAAWLIAERHDGADGPAALALLACTLPPKPTSNLGNDAGHPHFECFGEAWAAELLAYMSSPLANVLAAAVLAARGNVHTATGARAIAVLGPLCVVDESGECVRPAVELLAADDAATAGIVDGALASAHGAWPLARVVLGASTSGVMRARARHADGVGVSRTSRFGGSGYTRLCCVGRLVVCRRRKNTAD